MSEIVGDGPRVHPTATLTASILGRHTEVAERAHLEKVVLGDYSYVMEDCRLYRAEIGRFCSLAAFVSVGPPNHPMWRATQHHFTYRSAQYGFGPDDGEFFAWRDEFPVHVGPDVWMGTASVVLPGNTIGAGAVIAAGAVVTKDVPPYAVAAGCPARTVRFRFPEAVREGLLELAWWNWPHERIGAALEDFRSLSVEDFLEKHL